jgi:ribonuclease BN (tRNA processing enzyme)
MNLRIIGCGLSFPSPGGASSGYVVESQSERLLVDCGHGVVGKLEAALDLRDLSAIVISHMHPDHFLDLVPLKYAFFFQGIPPIPLLLPPGGRQVLERLQPSLGLADAFFADSFDPAEYEPVAVLDLAGFSIRFASTQHFIPGYAMRISESPTAPALFYSSDTGWTEPVVSLARGAALGLVEATLLDYPPDEEWHGHMTARLAGKLGRVAGIRRLVLTHYFTPVAQRLQEEAEAGFEGRVEVAKEGQVYPVVSL